MTKLLWWCDGFTSKIEKWILEDNPLFWQEWSDAKEEVKDLLHRSGLNPKGFNQYSHGCVVDRAGKKEFLYNSISVNSWVPYQEYPKQDFSDCMFETAQEIADQGKTIDICWSGGLDSNSVLFTFNEMGLHKQIRVISSAQMESPDVYKKIIKGRIDFVWDEEGSQETMYSLTKPDEHILCGTGECDPMWGGKSNFAGRGVIPKNATPSSFDGDASWHDSWEVKRRYCNNNSWRYVANFQGDWMNPDNYKAFFMSEPIEKWLCNYALSGDMIYHDLTHEGYGDWYATGDDPNAPSQEHYKKDKMGMRDHVYKLTGDRYLAYEIPKVCSGIRIKKAGRPLRVLAVTEKGTVITEENFNDFDWTKFIVNF
jgi:hypothetical protein